MFTFMSKKGNLNSLTTPSSSPIASFIAYEAKWAQFTLLSAFFSIPDQIPITSGSKMLKIINLI